LSADISEKKLKFFFQCQGFQVTFHFGLINLSLNELEQASMAKKAAAKKLIKKKMSGQEIIKAAIRLGAKDAKIINPGKVVTGHWVRWKCSYGCSAYQTNLMCPPYTPTPALTREMLSQYKRAVFFEATRGGPKKIAPALERELFLQGFYKAFGMGAGPCHLCKACAFEQGCKHPELARPALEGCGIDVFTTARANGFTIEVVHDENAEQHYFGMVLID
jgi:predicted metal-binding protein